MPNRTVPPKIHDVQSIELPQPEIVHLDNGVPVYITNLGTQEVSKLEIAFFAGRPYERKPLVARAVCSQLREGSRNYTSAQIAENLDFYGASLGMPFNLDTANLTLYSLNKHFGRVLPILKDMLAEPAFPEDDLRAFISRNQRRLEVDLARNDTVAYREITAMIFGEHHPYGYNSSMEGYAALARADLLEHYRRLYNRNNCLVFVSGRVTEKMLAQINEALSEALGDGQRASAEVSTPRRRPRRISFDRPGTLQSAVRLGREAFSRHHEDYFGLYILNTLLGGYFGSRLMTNIREEKGYTYNIYSMLENMRYGGSFLIGTEVSERYVEATLQEIYREMEQLQQERVGEEELKMVRNYLMGNFLTMLDGPFNIAEVVRTQALDGLPPDTFSRLVETVQHIDAGALQALAQKYLNKDEMWEVVVGPNAV